MSAAAGRGLGAFIGGLGSIGSLIIGWVLWTSGTDHTVAIGIAAGALINVLVVTFVLMMLADTTDAVCYVARVAWEDRNAVVPRVER